ncbi:MAG: hypothetical protein CVU97_04805 [Firmicutes bacterium HGW-Firmicutes-21]|nr:MAG: hypothetical protein CVU97_04805 [Firmicutes bacterium HGW-Firmicutes-21]
MASCSTVYKNPTDMVVKIEIDEENEEVLNENVKMDLQSGYVFTSAEEVNTLIKNINTEYDKGITQYEDSYFNDNYIICICFKGAGANYDQKIKKVKINNDKITVSVLLCNYDAIEINIIYQYHFIEMPVRYTGQKIELICEQGRGYS